MFAINTLLQDKRCANNLVRPRKWQQAANASTLIFDVGVIVITTITTLGIVKIFPKDFLTTRRMFALQTTAFMVGSLDLLTLIPLCYPLSKIKNELKTDNVRLEASQKIAIDSGPSRTSLIDMFFKNSMSDYPELFNEAFEKIYNIFFANHSLAHTFGLTPAREELAGNFYIRQRTAYHDAIDDRDYIFDNPKSIMEELGRKAAFKDLFLTVYKKNLDENLQVQPLQKDFDNGFGNIYKGTYNEVYEIYKAQREEEHLIANQPNRRLVINMNTFHYDPVFVNLIAEKICKTAQETAFFHNRMNT